MSILQVSERIIKDNFITLEEKENIKLNHNESTLYYNDNIVYKIFKPSFRLDREKNIHYLYEKNFPHANNIIDKLYQGDKLIGITNKYLDNFITMKSYMNKLDLYEIKKIISYLIKFYDKTLEKHLIYWDNHLNNIGISNGKFYILDIDSIYYSTYELEKRYALNGLLTLFYEMYYKNPIRNNYDNYRGIIHLISECDNYLKCQLTLKEIKKIINNTSEDFLESKRRILEFKKI